MLSCIRFRHLIEYPRGPVAQGAHLVALSNGEPVGTLCLGWPEQGAFVNSLYVDPAHRGLGIERGLLGLAAELSQAHGKPTLGIALHGGDPGARQLYQSLGFEAQGPVREEYARYFTRLPLVQRQYPLA